MTSVFSSSFLWGTATSAHQVEGGNVNTDVWVEEHVEGSPYKEFSGDAIHHYRTYREDIRLLASLGINSYRFSIEWARIEPEPGYYSKAELEHYRDVIAACKAHGLTPVVTMHHFTSPRWLMRFGGWKNPETADRFAKYCEVVFEAIGAEINHVVTINEANLPVLLKELFVNLNFIPPVGIDAASWTAPGWREAAAQRCGTTIENYFTFHMASDAVSLNVIMDAHTKSRAVIKRINPSAKVGLSLALPDVQHVSGGEAQAAAKWQEYFGQFLPAIAQDDFIGVQNYAREVYDTNGIIPVNKLTQEVNGMGVEFYPQSLAGAVRRTWADCGIPIMVTEHGIATDDDDQRSRLISEALKALKDCVIDGIPIIGYLHWSAFDNFEWTFGYGPRFGLIGVNRETQERTVKESANVLGRIASSNGAAIGQA